jgi:hypothetical protein
MTADIWEVPMRASRKRYYVPVLVMVLAACMLASLLALTGCGDDQAKQDFVNGMLSIMEENQSQPEIAAEGQQAFLAYSESGFTDLESAKKAADSFAASNEKDAQSLQRLDALEKPDESAQEVASTLQLGNLTMDEGNTIYEDALREAPEQSEEERSQIFASTGVAMSLYLEGIEHIISAFESLLEYTKTNGLEGEQEVDSWYQKFKSEKESIEQSMEAMGGI